jgi:hypothetical protein
MWMRVRLGYENGGLSLNAWFANAGCQIRREPNGGAAKRQWHHSSPFHAVWLFLGAGLTWGMMIMRSRFAWFPFHPLGYLVCITYPIQKIWFSVFVGWAAKCLVTRFGGNETYRKTTPLFLGLALGDVAMILLWLLIDGWQGRTNHFLVPN